MGTISSNFSSVNVIVDSPFIPSTTIVVLDSPKISLIVLIVICFGFTENKSNVFCLTLFSLSNSIIG